MYIDGFAIPVKIADREKFIEHAAYIDKFFLEHGALRVVEGWGSNVPAGKVTDFFRAVAAEEGETVAFSWIEWPDQATRDKAMDILGKDPELMKLPMPFDGKRMIFGGFESVVDLRGS